jgi:hypothetical protein
VRISSLNCVAAGAAFWVNILSCGGAFTSLEQTDTDAGGDGGGGNQTTAGAAGSAGTSGRSGSNTAGGSGGTGGRAGADAGAPPGKGGSAGGSGSGGKGGSSGQGGGSGGSSGRAGSAGAIDAGGAAGSSGQADASRRDGDATGDAFGPDRADGSAGSSGSVSSDARTDISEGGIDSGSGDAGGSVDSDARTDISEGGMDTGPICSSPPPSDCAFCCTMAHPTGVREYQQRMYGCACSDCYPQCAMTLCDSNTPDPSVPCLTCIRQRSETGNCAPGRESCAQNVACAGYMSCAHACFPAAAQ